MTRLVTLAVVFLLLGAAPPVREIPVGKFQVWVGHDKKPLRFMSAGVEVSVEALPCSTNTNAESTCRFDGYNNQAAITVAAPGLPPFRVVSDDEASVVRVAVVRIDRRSPRLGVIVDNQLGGSAGLTAVSVIEPQVNGYHAVPIRRRPDERLLEGELRDSPVDRSGDGIVDLILTDPAFDGSFGCNACTPRPPVVLTIRHGKSIDISTERSVRAVFAADIGPRRAFCLSGHRYRNGNCVAYLADAARLGRVHAAWTELLAHYERGPEGHDVWQSCDVAPNRRPHGACPPDHASHYRSFPESLRAFLIATGYLTPQQAATLPVPKTG